MPESAKSCWLKELQLVYFHLKGIETNYGNTVKWQLNISYCMGKLALHYFFTIASLIGMTSEKSVLPSISITVNVS